MIFLTILVILCFQLLYSKKIVNNYVFAPHKCASTYLHKYMVHLQKTYDQHVSESDKEEYERNFLFHRLTTDGFPEDRSLFEGNFTDMLRRDNKDAECNVIVQIRNPFDILISSFYS